MKKLAMAATLVLALSIPAWAGEVPTMGVVGQPPPPPQGTSITTTILITLLSLGLVGR